MAPHPVRNNFCFYYVYIEQVRNIQLFNRFKDVTGRM